MINKTRKSSLTKKAAKKITGKTKAVKAVKKPVAKSVAGARKPVAKLKAIAGAKKTVSITTGPKSGDSDRGLYVRFETPAIKAKVMAMADKTGVSMNAYIVASVLDWVEQGKALANPKDAAAAERVAAAG